MSARVFVPGRIEVLGKHTDYAGGSSLLLAVDRGFTFEAEPLADDRIVFIAEDSGEQAAYAIVRTGNVVRAVAEDCDGAGGAPAGDPQTHAAAGVPPGFKVGPAAAADEGSSGQAHGSAGRVGAARRPGWARYVDGVLANTFASFGASACGALVRFRSSLPAAAGLSSSSALVTGVFLALDAVCRFSEADSFRRAVPDRHALAGFLSAAEMGGPVGTRGGSEDHVAILCARPGHIVRYRLAPIRFRGAAPVPEGWTFAVGASGVVADKGGGVQAHYNRLSDLAAHAAHAWAAGAGVAEDRTLNLGDALAQAHGADALFDAIVAGARGRGEDPEPLVRRARHFVEECALVDAAFEALERGAVDAFAKAVNRSAAIGAELLENQVPETLRLTALAGELGAPAASPFGAGFGGAVWALVRADDAARFTADWRSRYLGAYPDRTGAVFFTTGAGAAASTH